MSFEPDRLDDPTAREAGDPGGMLRAVASSAAQIRESYRAAVEAELASIAIEGRPRAIIVAGMGGSAIAGDVLAAVCGNGCPIPMATVRSYRLPGWVGPSDLVIAVSCSGRTEETLAVAAEAVRRGCRLLTVGVPSSPLSSLAEQAGAPLVPVRAAAGQPRATLWGLAVPLVVLAEALELVVDPGYEAAAKRLEDVAHRCRAASDAFLNPGKTLATELAGSVPMIWGSSPLAAVAAYRLACQLNENAKYAAIWGELPEANHNQVVAFDGALDSLRLVILRDTEEHPQVARRREASARLAHDRGIPVSELVAEGLQPLERLAGLVGVGDFASVYLGLGYGVDPTPVTAIEELKARIAP